MKKRRRHSPESVLGCIPTAPTDLAELLSNAGSPVVFVGEMAYKEESFGVWRQTTEAELLAEHQHGTQHTTQSGWKTAVNSVGQWASDYGRNFVTQATTAGATIVGNGSSAGTFVGEHGWRIFNDFGGELSVIGDGLVDNATDLQNFGEQISSDPLGTAQSLGSGLIGYVDEITLDPTASGPALGNGTTAWATLPIGGAAGRANSAGSKFLKGFKGLQRASNAVDKIDDAIPSVAPNLAMRHMLGKTSVPG